MTRSRRARALALAAILAAAAVPAATGFDTGHHADLTYEALQAEGFGPSAIQAVQVENWLTDYYSGPMGRIPFLISDLGKLRAEFAAIEPEMARLHFDNLQDTEQVRNSWGWLTHNTRVAVQQAARNKDVLHGLALMGLSLHAVQDFYTHSNWVEALNGKDGEISVLRTATFSADPVSASGRGLWTGSYPPDRQAPPPLSRQPHGSYSDKGLNHDSYVRPNWLPAYVAAYAASRQWVKAFHTWVDEMDRSGDYWRALQSYRPSGEDQRRLEADVEATYKISEWILSPDHNGHWKGNGSGSPEFIPYIAAWAAKTDSPYVGEVKQKRAQRELIVNLTSDGSRVPPIEVSSGEKLSAVALPRQALLIRTLHAKRLGAGVIPPVANMFAEVKVSGPGFDHTFREAMQAGKPEISPKWTTVKFLPDAAAPVDVEYRLINEGGPVAGPTRTYGVNGASESLKFRVNPRDGSCSGDIRGRPDASRQTIATFRGSGRTFQAEAEVTIAVQVVPVE